MGLIVILVVPRIGFALCIWSVVWPASLGGMCFGVNCLLCFCCPLYLLNSHTHRRLGKPFMDLFTDVTSQGTQHSKGTFTCKQFVWGMLCELSVCLCCCNAMWIGIWLGVLCVCGGCDSPLVIQLAAEDNGSGVVIQFCDSVSVVILVCMFRCSASALCIRRWFTPCNLVVCCNVCMDLGVVLCRA
jgi:hypothetical protein